MTTTKTTKKTAPAASPSVVPDAPTLPRPGSVLSLKLTTDEEIIGRIESVGADAYVLLQPLSLVRSDHPNDPDREFVELRVFMASAGSATPVQIDTRHVTASCKPAKAIASAYVQKTAKGFIEAYGA